MTDKHPGGRPSKYDPAYCEQVIDFMALGYSLTAFAGEIGVTVQTLHNWRAEHPAFFDAVRVGQAKRVRKLETDLLETDVGARVTSRIFALKNAGPDEWRDKQQHELSGPNGGPIETTGMDVRNLSKEERAALKALLLKAKGNQEEPE